MILLTISSSISVILIIDDGEHYGITALFKYKKIKMLLTSNLESNKELLSQYKNGEIAIYPSL